MKRENLEWILSQVEAIEKVLAEGAFGSSVLHEKVADLRYVVVDTLKAIVWAEYLEARRK